jgi:Putative prokaryotic signal transducing protein
MPEVTLTVVGDELEAEALCGLLRVNGIDCSYRRTDVSAGRADGSNSMSGPTQIVVNDADLEAARGLLPKS